MASGLSFDAKGLLSGLSSLQSKTDAALRMYAETSGQKLRTFAQENRRWTDRTGDARKRLNSSVAKISNGYRIYLAHGVDYGIWLELAHEKKYAIIPITIEIEGTFEIIPGLEKLIERLNSIG